jgi:hypothetical protein
LKRYSNDEMSQISLVEIFGPGASLTMNVPLISTVQEGFFFRGENISWVVSRDFSKGAETFLTPRLS